MHVPQALEPANIEDPYRMYERLRRDAPVAYVPERDLYLVTRYETVLGILADPVTYSSAGSLSSASVFADNPEALQILRQGEGYPRRPTLILTDPPEHKRYREVMQRALDPGATMRALIPKIRDRVNELIDDFTEGRCEFVRDFAYPLPMMVVSEILSVPREDIERLKRWSDDFIAAQAGNIDRERAIRCAQSTVEFEAYFAPRLRQRQERPTEDFLSRLVAPPTEGAPLTVQELLSLVQQMLVGGNETTTNLLGSAMHIFLGTDGLWDRLRADPSLLPRALEEVLRYESPLQGLFRQTTTDVVLDGVAVPAGSRLMISFGSANRDERVFEEPGYRADRDNAFTHVAFGRGAHSCLGQTLARREAVIAFEALLERLVNPRVVADEAPTYVRLFGFRGLAAFHVEFDDVADA